ncbi:hypothetical protein, partial [Nonomuraea sp. NPDC003201]
ASAGAVLADRPGCRLALAEPTFSWYGSGLPLLRARDKDAVETAVTGGLLAAVAATELRPPSAARDRARDGGEPIDPERHAPLVRRYVVDSYEPGGEPAAVEIQMEAEDVTSGSWTEILDTPDPEWDTADWNNALLVSAMLADQDRPASGLVALLFAGGEGVAGIRLFVVSSMRSGGVSVTGDGFGIRNLRSFEIDEWGRTAERHLTLGPDTRGVLRALGDTPDEQSRTALLRDWMTRTCGARFDQERARLLKTLGEDRFEQVKQAELERLAHLNADPPPVVGYVELEVHGRTFLLSLAAQFGHPKGTEIPIVPLTVQVQGVSLPGAEEGERPGGGGGVGPGVATSGRAPVEEGGTGGTGGRPGGTGTADEGGFVEVPAIAAGGTRPFLPPPGEESVTCTPFLEEPPLAALGRDGDRLRALIERIAGKLAIPVCEYAGGFTLTAAEAFGSRATDVGDFSVTASKAYLQAPPAGEQGNLGPAHFTPAPSPLIAFLRHLGGVAPDITELVDTIDHVYRKPEHRGKIGFLDNPLSWVVRFRYRVNDAMSWSVAVLFAMACRVLMMQLLTASARQIQGRLGNLPLLTDYFEQVILPRLGGIQDLIELRDLVKDAPRTPQLPERPPGGTPDPPAPPPSPDPNAGGTRQAWLRARADLTEALAGKTAEPPPGTPPRGTIIWPVTGDPRIHDGRGRTWSLREIEERIVTVRGDLESADPLVKQLTELDDVMARFTHGRVREELERLLNEMLRHNGDEQKKVRDSWRYAFQASRITTGIPTVPGTGYRLGGIHLQVHQAVGDAFRGDPFYRLGIDMLFGVQRGRLGLKAFAEFAGLLLLSVVCPPLAVVTGVVVAGAQLYEAVQREHLYRSMLDPELVLSRAEVEAELFAARLGFVLSVVLAVVPNARSLLRTGAQAARVAEGYGAATATRLTAARFTAHLAEETVKSLRNGFVVAALRELVQNEVVDLIAQRVLGPIIADLEREVTLTGPVGGAAGARRVVDWLLQEERP